MTICNPRRFHTLAFERLEPVPFVIALTREHGTTIDHLVFAIARVKGHEEQRALWGESLSCRLRLLGHGSAIGNALQCRHCIARKVFCFFLIAGRFGCYIQARVFGLDLGYRRGPRNVHRGFRYRSA